MSEFFIAFIYRTISSKHGFEFAIFASILILTQIFFFFFFGLGQGSCDGEVQCKVIHKRVLEDGDGASGQVEIECCETELHVRHL